MANENDNNASEVEGPVCGERLAEARREQQISVLEIAKELHLDEPKVRALERNDFDILGAPVFAKGHLKKYAQLVNVDSDDVLVDYYKLTRASAAPPVISTRPKPKKELSPGPWIGLTVIIILVVTAFWWFTRPATPVAESSDMDSPAVPTNEVVLPSGDDNSDEVVEEPVAEIDEPAAEQEQAGTQRPAAAPEQTAVATLVVEQASPAPPPAIEAGQMHLLITYSGDCWTDISDATGRQLLRDLGKDGQTVELRGMEPFSILFGDSRNVGLQVNGEDRALPATNRADQSLRFTLSGS